MKQPINIILVLIVSVGTLVVILVGLSVYLAYMPYSVEAEEVIENKDMTTHAEGVDQESGLKLDTGFEIVRASCTPCHSGMLVTQNRATREGWESMIVWMQETQGLWDLGENKELILDYLAKNYAPENKGRRIPLDNIEWYELEN